MPEDRFADPDAIRNLTVWDQAGKRIGSIEQVYVDDFGGRARWATVRLDGHGEQRGTGETFVPLAGAELPRSGGLRLPCSAAAVAAAPLMSAEQHLGLDQEQELYLHYGLTPPEGVASGAVGVGLDRPKTPAVEGEQDLAGIKELSDEPEPLPRLRRYEPGEEKTARRGPGGASRAPTAGPAGAGEGGGPAPGPAGATRAGEREDERTD
jgi:hypothetical protein